jgi:hypothetical protein
MIRRSTAARRGVLVVLLALAGLGAAACTTVRDPAYDTAYGARHGAAAPGGYGYAAAPYGGSAAAPGAGDTYCQEAAAAVRRSAAEAAYTGSPRAASRLARTRDYASRDC